MTPRFQAVLFDVDGTLLDSTQFVLGAMERALALHGLPVPGRARLAAIIGPPLTECYRELAPAADAASLCAAHRAWQREQLYLIHPFPNTLATLETLRLAQVRLAAVTARSKVSSLSSLEQAGLAGLLEFTISAEDAPRTKPHPDPVLLALERLGVGACDAVMVGDTASDIQAGQAAGVKTIGARYGFASASLATVQPDWVIDDISQVVTIVLGPTRYGGC